MRALKGTPAARNLLAGPAPQTGTPGPVTLVIGAGFAGVNRSLAAHAGQARRGRHRKAGGYGSATFVQARNAGASICSGLPVANRNSGSPP